MGFNFEAMYKMPPDICGHLLREMFFAGQDDAPEDAVKLTEEEKKLFCGNHFTFEVKSSPCEGYSFYIGEIQCFCLWPWNGDETLLFILPKRALVNTDRKKDHGWVDI